MIKKYNFVLSKFDFLIICLNGGHAIIYRNKIFSK